MIILYHILRKSIGGFRFIKQQEKFNNLMYMEDVKLFANNEKGLKTDTNNKYIQCRYNNGIWHGKIFYANKEKQKKK